MDDQSALWLFVEPEAVISDAEAEFFGVAVQHFDVSITALGESVERGENTHRGGAARCGARRHGPVA